MKPTDRDNLLIRLDERSTNTWRLVEKIEVHLVELNESVSNNKTGVAVNKKSINLLWKIGGGCATIILTGTAVILKLFGVY